MASSSPPAPDSPVLSEKAQLAAQDQPKRRSFFSKKPKDNASDEKLPDIAPADVEVKPKPEVTPVSFTSLFRSGHDFPMFRVPHLPSFTTSDIPRGPNFF